MILTSFLLLASGVRVSVFGEGRLCFEAGSGFTFASTAILASNPARLLADAQGHPVFPHIRLSGPAFAVSIDGTVTVAGHAAGRLMLQNRDGKLGHPGDDAFGVIQVEGAGTKAKAQSTVRTPQPVTDELPSRVVIAVHPRSEVEGDRILLRDVADLAGDPRAVERLGRIDLAPTPVLGGSRSLARWVLMSALKDSGVDDKAYSIEPYRDATVARKAQTVDAKAIVDAASAEVRRRSNGAEPTLLPGPMPAPVLAPLGALKLETTMKTNGDRMQVVVTTLVDGRSICDRTVDFKVKLDGVRIGDAVRIFVACGGAAIETDAKAKTGGNVGDAIQIVTSDGTLLTATVTGTGKAEVKL